MRGLLLKGGRERRGGKGGFSPCKVKVNRINTGHGTSDSSVLDCVHLRVVLFVFFVVFPLLLYVTVFEQ